MYELTVTRRDTITEHRFPLAPIERLLGHFDPITLPEMEDVSLLDRMDTKYVVGLRELYAALEQVTGQYRVLTVNHVRLHDYQTLYFDTGDFTLYHQHHNGMGERYKVRSRRYVDTDLSFFEVKYRTNQDRTIKSRLRIPGVVPQIDGQASEFLDQHTPFDAAQLEPKLWNDYLRITLVSKVHVERVTLDLNLSFGWQDARSALPGIAIVEIKQAVCSQDSDFIQQMRRFGVRPMSLSKYCAGVCMLYDNVKINNFKPQMRQVEKVMQEAFAHEYAH